MILVDVHSHLDHALLKDRLDEIIKNAKDAGVKKIITAGVNSKTNRTVLVLAEKYDIVEASLGIYPIEALRREIAQDDNPLRQDEFDVDAEIDFIRQNKDQIVAVGEVGLDYNHKEMTENEKDRQKELFRQMICLSKELDKPLIIHSRKAEQDVIEILEEMGAKKVVMHCFSGKFKLVKQIVDNGWYLSIPANITRNELFQKIAREVNIQRLLTETDAPYLPSGKGTINEPAFVSGTIRIIAEQKQMDPIEVANNIYMNYRNVFE